MTRRLFLLLAIAGLAGYGLFFLLFPRINPASRWRQEIDRATAIRRAQEVSRRFGVEATGWTTWVSTSYERNLDPYLAEQPNPLLGDRLTPVQMAVTMADLRQTGNRITITLSSRGEVLGIEFRDPLRPPRRPPGGGPSGRPPRPRPDENPQNAALSEADLARNQQIAEAALRDFFGDDARSLTVPPRQVSQFGRSEYTWLGSDERMKLTLEIAVYQGKLDSVKLDVTPTEAYRLQLDARRPGRILFFSNVGNFVLWPSIIALIILYFISLARKQINHRQSLVLMGLSFVVLLVANYLGSFYDNFREDFKVSGASRPIYWLESTVPVLLYVLMFLAISAALYFLWATGTSISGVLAGRRTIDLELALRGRVLTRPVMGSVLAGALAGGAVAAIPYLIAASGLFGAVLIDPAELDDLFSARWPAGFAALAGSQFAIFMVYAFLAQIVDTYVPRRFVALSATWLLTFLTATQLSQIQIPLAAAVAATAALATLLTGLYYRFGVLAPIVAIGAWQMALDASVLIAQPAAGLRASGFVTAGLLLAGGGVAALAFWKAREATDEEVAPRNAGANIRAERERLKAEFDVARRAQQHMLPDAPPNLAGFRISAICQPSKEVGGDLYDFLTLPNGKTGIVVADVSGKGVPASLYMTLTKGLLSSVSEEKSDPGEILREVNRHLYAVCQRKMFVTLFLGVLDPANRSFSYARAGHNPTVLRRPLAGETTLLKPRGMGLGLNSGKIFDQSLKVETLQLHSRDKLFFYSDGITEAMNVQNDEYGEERLMEIAEKVDELPAEASLLAVMEDVRQFLGPNAPQDDQTLVVVEVM